MTHPLGDPYYPAYLPPGIDLAEEVRLREASRSDPFIIIDYRSHTDTWRAWWTDKISLLGELEGTREQVIAWARERCDDIRICSDPDDENALLVELGPDDQ
ncbi:MAG TPA: hypothetical protein VGB75_10970 [Jatrophihabitans sp.]|jgi:hypothetical protein|uniref:hypothetical protein n=1 Tax=Jatrophihabitans sp. TaxID=1932789 RepID=UPI002EF72945